ncbi:MAG TPA: helix-turn-helix transcriptional regulator [Acidimicrobiia bacterium]|jgi:transcriptional regulator with XRE-family HTH domain|nr:helix-turn-helix transcriptional regulator [Acidimicrobiia bacterium]
MPTTQLSREEWLESNPLRRWRTRERVSIMTAAARIGCSTSSIQKWEAGASQPTAESLVDIASATGRDAESLARAWTRWTKQQPA